MNKKYNLLIALASWALLLYFLIQTPLSFLPRIILTLLFGYLAIAFTTKLIIKNNEYLFRAFFYTLLAIILFSYGSWREPVLIMPSIVVLLGILYFIFRASKPKKKNAK